MIKIDGFVLLLAFITVGGLCYGAGQIGFKNLWGFDDDQPNRKVQ